MQHRHFFVLILTAILALAGPVAADALDDAKAAGLVGEQANGYLGIVKAPGSTNTQALIADINDRRRDRYQSIAENNGLELEAVELLAGQKTIEKTPTGQFIRPAAGSWRSK